MNISATRVRQLADVGLLTFETTALGRLYDPESVEQLAAERAEQAARDPRVRMPVALS